MFHSSAEILSVKAPVGYEQEQLDILEALLSHVQWKKRLLNYIQRNGEVTLDPERVQSDSNCSLGHWIHGYGGDAYGNTALFVQLKALHGEFHRHAAAIVRAVNQGQGGEALNLLRNGEYTKTANRFNALLARISLGYDVS